MVIERVAAIKLNRHRPHAPAWGCIRSYYYVAVWAPTLEHWEPDELLDLMAVMNRTGGEVFLIEAGTG